MKLQFVCTTPMAALFLISCSGIASADTSDVKGPAPLVVAKSGKHCKDDPNCFNRIHYAIKPVAHVKPGQQFVLETRDGLDSDLDFNRPPRMWRPSTWTVAIR
jgi:formamidase